MRALIRHDDKEGDFYPETAWSPFTINHLTWHRTANPEGDGYALAENAPVDAVAEDFDITIVNGIGTATLNTSRYNARLTGETVEESATVTVIEEDDSEETIIIDGKEYTKAELRALLGE